MNDPCCSKRITKPFLAVCLFLWAPLQAGYAQTDPCGRDFNFSVTKDQLLNDGVDWSALGRNMQRCDSLLVMSKLAFGTVVVERAFQKARGDSLAVLVGVLERGQALRDTLSARQEAFIQFQRQKLDEYDALLVRSNQLVDDATKNTDRALRQIKLYKLLSAGGLVLGAAGVLIGAALAVN
jgi:hypothetical protein